MSCALGTQTTTEQHPDKVNDGKIQGRFFVIDHQDLDFARKSTELLKVSLIRASDTLASIFSEDETYRFDALPDGLYQIIVEYKEQPWISPDFQVTQGKTTQISSNARDLLAGVKDSPWCIRQWDHTHHQNGTLTLDFNAGDWINSSDSVQVYLTDRFDPDVAAQKFKMPADQLITMTAAPGIYELWINLDRSDQAFKTHYTPIQLNVWMAPGIEQHIAITEWKVLDLEVPLFMTNPTLFFQLNNPCSS